jgi:hypothetical protein
MIGPPLVPSLDGKQRDWLVPGMGPFRVAHTIPLRPNPRTVAQCRIRLAGTKNQ